MTQQAIYQHLRELRDHFTPPQGFTFPEISDGTFVMMMSPVPGTSSRPWMCATNWPANCLPE